MDLNRSVRPRNGHLKTASAGPLLAVPPHEQPYSSPGSSSAAGDHELFEDDVLWTDDTQIVPNDHRVNGRSSPTSSSSSHHVHRKLLVIRSPDRFGILGVLPEHQTACSVLIDHKAAVGSCTSPPRSTPNPPKERSHYSPSTSTAIKGRYHQSMPVNVPVLPAASMIKRRHRDFDHDEGDESDDDRPMLPPHEMVVRSMAQSEMLAFSVLEGAGRMLKGRDLRQVRNAVFQRTGFLD